MSILPIYTYGTAVLRQKAKPVTKVTNETIRLIMDMFETMRKANGIGLAAVQVGCLERIIVVDVSEMEGLEEIKPFVLINPEVLSETNTCILEEGCLSIPDVREEVERAEQISLRYKNTGLEDRELEASGMIARVILHEIDHLNGKLFVDHLSADKKKVHAEELKLIQRGEVDSEYPVITAATVTT
jgi:peptide deformylase